MTTHLTANQFVDWYAAASARAEIVYAEGGRICEQANSRHGIQDLAVLWNVVQRMAMSGQLELCQRPDGRPKPVQCRSFQYIARKRAKSDWCPPWTTGCFAGD